MTDRKLLVVSGLQIFPPTSGGTLRTASLVSALAARGFDVHIYSMVGRKVDYKAGLPSSTSSVGERLVETVERGRFWAALQFLSYRAHLPPVWITAVLALFTPPALAQLIAASDAVIIDFPFLYPAVRGSRKPAVLNTHNVEADLWTRLGIKKLVAAIERRAALAIRRVVCCSEDDRAYFAGLLDKQATCVVPNGIDTERFTPFLSQREALRQSLGYRSDDKVLLFAASSFGPNVEALDWLKTFTQAHQSLLARRKLHFLVAGSVSKTAFEQAHLKVVGMVPVIEPYFAAADLAFNGVFRGSGTNVKMGEFMAAGLPILTSDVGTRGFAIVDGEDALVFTKQTLAHVLGESAILDDKIKLQSMARRAFEKNRRVIDMRLCIEPLAGWLAEC